MPTVAADWKPKLDSSYRREFRQLTGFGEPESRQTKAQRLVAFLAAGLDVRRFHEFLAAIGKPAKPTWGDDDAFEVLGFTAVGEPEPIDLEPLPNEILKGLRNRRCQWLAGGVQPVLLGPILFRKTKWHRLRELLRCYVPAVKKSDQLHGDDAAEERIAIAKGELSPMCYERPELMECYNASYGRSRHHPKIESLAQLSKLIDNYITAGESQGYEWLGCSPNPFER